MPESKDPSVILAYWKDHREQLRQSESQRAVMTNYILVITAAISGLVVQQHFSARTIPLSTLTTLIGIYGAVAAAKYHERADYHLRQARALTKVLVDAGALADTREILNDFRNAHYNKYPRLAENSPILALDRVEFGHRRIRDSFVCYNAFSLIRICKL